MNTKDDWNDKKKQRSDWGDEEKPKDDWNDKKKQRSDWGDEEKPKDDWNDSKKPGGGFRDFRNTLRIRLKEKEYIEVRPPVPIELAMLKQTFGGMIPKIIAIIDGSYLTDEPSTTFDGVTGWFKGLLGN